MPRLKLLNTVEQEAFDWPLVFNSVQHKQYFDFSTPVQEAAASLRTPTNQLCFMLSCAYFKASNRFFPVRTFHPRNIEYVAGRAELKRCRYGSALARDTLTEVQNIAAETVSGAGAQGRCTIDYVADIASIRLGK